MITKDLIKTEVDNVPDEYLEVLFRVIKAFELPPNSKTVKSNSNIKKTSDSSSSWHEFIQETYGQIRATFEKAGTPIGPNDLLIAAIAVTNSVTLVMILTWVSLGLNQIKHFFCPPFFCHYGLYPKDEHRVDGENRESNLEYDHSYFSLFSPC